MICHGEKKIVQICKHAFDPQRRTDEEGGIRIERIRTTEGPFSACFVSIWAAYRRHLSPFQISVGTPPKTGKSAAYN